MLVVINLFSVKDLGLVDIGQKGPKGITTISVQIILAGRSSRHTGGGGGQDRSQLGGSERL